MTVIQFAVDQFPYPRQFAEVEDKPHFIGPPTYRHPDTVRMAVQSSALVRCRQPTEDVGRREAEIF